MAYTKDPKTGKYINTGSAPVSPPLTTSKPSSAGTAVKYQKNAEGKFVTTEVEKTAGKPNVTTVEGLRDFALQNNVDVSSTQPKESRPELKNISNHLKHSVSKARSVDLLQTYYLIQQLI